jgi:Putative auto-transporter adhesin, head GIN domain
MRRTPPSLSVAVLLVAGCTSSGGTDPGPAKTQDRTIGAVSAVALATSGDLTLTTGDTPALRVTAPRDVIDHLTSEVRDDRLTLGTDRPVATAGDIRYELVLPAARHLEVSGSGDARAASPSALGEVVLDGSGDVRVEGLTTDGFDVALSGSGDVAVAGRTARQQVQVAGSGRYDARQLDSADADVTVSGSGSADVQVSGSLRAVVQGSGAITYGGGATVDSRVAGSGSVEER